MLPQSITTLLNRLRRRERLLALAWATARWLSALAAVVVAFCLVDYVYDRYEDTPGGLRIVMGAGAALFAMGALSACVRAAARHGATDAEVALWVEERFPKLHHRLISAVQFHSDRARTRGMSPALIGAVTEQAEQMAREVSVGQVRDSGRFRKAALLAGPVLAAVLLLVVIDPALARLLLARLALGSDEPIPRSVTVMGGTVETWPAGEEGVLRVAIVGRLPGPEAAGVVRVQREDGTFSRHALELSELVEERPDVAIYTARVPAGDVPFSYTARLADGRMKFPGAVEYSPRPVVQSVQAWVQLPEAVGLRPGELRYEEPQKAGDIIHRLPDSRARVRVAIQKPVHSARVRVLGGAPRLERLTPSEDGLTAVGTFDLHPDDTGYEIEVRDSHHFVNADRPRRAISRGSLELPEVTLLPENFAPKGHGGPLEDYEAEGVPVAVNAPFKLDYACSHRYGLSHVQLRYRVVRRGAKEESGPVDTSKFLTLPLGPTLGQAGKPTAQALREFSTRPASSPEAIPDTEGGGAYDFELTGVPDGQGGRLKIGEGDRVQFYVEAFSKAAPDGTPGRSAVREKEVVSEKGYSDWFLQKINLTERTRELEERQRGAPPPGGPS